MTLDTPAPGRVDLWYVPLDDFSAGEQAACLELLSPPEQERHHAFKSSSAQLQHLAGRGLLRTTLSRYRNIAPGNWRFRTNRYGRPFVDGPEIRDLHFSLSHTHGMAVCAIASIEEIGVDVEARDREVGLDELAANVLAAPERARFDALRGPARQEFFFTLWTLKEAYVKARGMGLSLPMKEVVLDVDGPAPAASLGGGIDDDAARWTFRTVPLPAGHIAGVSAALPADRLKIVARQTRAINLPPETRAETGGQPAS